MDCVERQEPAHLRPADEPAAGAAKAPHPPPPPPASPTKQERPPIPFAGIIASCLASVFFSTGMLCVKLLPGASVHMQLKALMFRGFFMQLLSGCAILCQRASFRVAPNELLVNVMRVLFGGMAVFTAYLSLMYISLGDSTALVFSSPLWTCLLSWLILKERLQLFHLVAVPFSFLGIVLIAHPTLVVHEDFLSEAHRQALALESASEPAPAVSASAANQSAPLSIELSVHWADLEMEANRWLGVCLGLVSSIFVSLTYIVLTFRKHTPVQVTTFWFGLSLTVACAAVLLALGRLALPRTFHDAFLLAMNGVCSWLGQSLFQWAFFYEKAGTLSVLRSMDVAVSFVSSAIFLDDEIYWTSVLGSAILASVVVYIMSNAADRTKSCSPPPPANNNHCVHDINSNSISHAGGENVYVGRQDLPAAIYSITASQAAKSQGGLA